MINLALLDQKTMQLVSVLVISLVVFFLLQIFTRPLVNNISTGSPRGRRLRTLSNVIRTIVSTIILTFAVFESLSVLGVNLAPLVAAAGVSGLAIGFGSQALVKDIISGFFLLAENQIDEGDDVEIAGKRGIVEKISLRTLWLKEKNGAVHIIPSGTITLVTNYSRGYSDKEEKKKLDKKEK